MVLKSTEDFDVRTKLLSKLDSKANVITLDILSRECQRIINLKTDTALIENAHGENQVHRLQLEKIRVTANQIHHAGIVAACTMPVFACIKNHKCEECNKLVHKEGYCFKRKINKKHSDPSYNSGPEARSIFTCNTINSSLRKHLDLLHPPSTSQKGILSKWPCRTHKKTI
ncbi:hypothetical protein CVS40_11246 [Lucilia cuprina]|nr:hypothetical protein CVS40_11246 [Lucilia cuprina]